MRVKDVNEAIGFWDSFRLRVSENEKGLWLLREYFWVCGCHAVCSVGAEDDLWFMPCDVHLEFSGTVGGDGMPCDFKNAAINALAAQKPKRKTG